MHPLESLGKAEFMNPGGSVEDRAALGIITDARAGITLYFKERNPGIATVGADPYGAAIWSWFTHGHTNLKDGDSFAEGIGQSRVTKNLEGIVIKAAVRNKGGNPPGSLAAQLRGSLVADLCG